MKAIVTNRLAVSLGDQPEIEIRLSQEELKVLRRARDICQCAHQMLEERYGVDYDDMYNVTPYHSAALELGVVLEDD